MPDESTGVDQGLSPDSNADLSLGNAADATDQTKKDGSKTPAPVPYDRFKEVNEGRKSAEDRATRLEGMIQQQGQQFQAILATVMANRGAQTPEKADDQPQNILDDPELQGIAAEFGDDAEGKKAFRTLVRLAETIADKKLKALPKSDDQPITRKDIETLVDSKIGNFTATFQTNSTLQSWRDKGFLDDSGLEAVTRRMGEIINADAKWGEAHNQPHLLNQVYMEMLTSGKIKPGTPQPRRSGSPLQMGGRGGADRTQAEIERALDDEAKTLQRRFPRRFGHMTIDNIKKMMPADSRTAVVQQTERGPVDSRIVNDTYVHTRG